MNPTFLGDILNDLRFSFASVLAIWFSLFVPAVLIAAGVMALGGGVREVGGVAFALAVFAAADWIFLIWRFAQDVENDDDRVETLLDLSTLRMARFLSQRYL